MYVLHGAAGEQIMMLEMLWLIRKNLIYLIGLFKAQKDAKTEKDIKCN